MPTKPLDRLMFAQGGMCFFCKSPLPKSEASVEHLVASANGGSNNDENCVACCKTVNALLGSMSLKEKIQLVLNRRGQFKCANGAASVELATPPKASTPTTKESPARATRFQRHQFSGWHQGQPRPAQSGKITHELSPAAYRWTVGR